MASRFLAGIRVHYKGLFQFGAPDVVVVNVTKDAIWTRRAVLPEAATPVRPSPREAIELFDLSPAQTEVRFPNPRHSVADVQERFVRDQEIDPRKYYPADVYREPSTVFPDGFKIDVKQMAMQQIGKKIKAKVGELEDKLKDRPLPRGLRAMARKLKGRE